MSYKQFTFESEEASWRYEFSQRLRQILEYRGIGSTQFSRDTGIKKSSLDSYLSGSTIPNYYRMVAMAESLGLTVEQLVNLKSPKEIYGDEYEDDEEDDELDDYEDFI